MPLQVKGLLFTFLTATLACVTTSAQQLQANSRAALNDAINTIDATPAVTPTMQDKLAKVRALIAARLLPTAAFELEKLNKETSDETFQSAVRAMLVGVLLEQPNYERAKELLQETFERNRNRRNATENSYLPIAGQVIKSAYSQLERYKKTGFNLSDPNLPAEAATDLDRWRKLLEIVCEQAKLMSVDEKRTAESLAILEAAAEARGSLSRDEYEARAWRNAVEDTREMIANAQTKVTDVDGAAVDMKSVASINLPQVAAPVATANVALSNKPPQTAVATQPSAFLTTAPLDQPAVNASAQTNAANVKTAGNSTLSVNNSAPELKAENAPAASNSSRLRTVAENAAAATNQLSDAPKVQAESNAPKTEVKSSDNNNSNVLKVYSLIDMATRKVNPNYPTMARTARIGGVVKVEVVIDEKGAVSEIKNSEGPEMLRRAAIDAVRRWKFKPAIRDGQAVRMTGFVNFNFAL